MRIAIVDDEQYWSALAKKIISECLQNDEIEIEIYKSGKHYLESNKKYDISFVDIEMPELDGFKTIESARRYNDDGVYIILTTHTEMSRKGYQVNAFRYIDKTRLEIEIPEAIESANVILGRNKRITINVMGSGEREIVLKNIIYIETEGQHILIHTDNNIIKCLDRLKEIEKLLEPEWFFRCHNSYIVNIDKIIRVDEKMLYMSNGKYIEVSQRKMSCFNKVFLDRQYKCGNA